jgi:hypothetical protein
MGTSSSAPKGRKRAVGAWVVDEGVEVLGIQLPRCLGLHMRGDAIDVVRVRAENHVRMVR